MKRKQYSSQFKAKVALEACKNNKTIGQIASEYTVHPNQVSHWKKQMLSEIPSIFENGRKKRANSDDQLVPELYRQIGQLKVELDWLQKKSERFS